MSVSLESRRIITLPALLPVEIGIAEANASRLLFTDHTIMGEVFGRFYDFARRGRERIQGKIKEMILETDWKRVPSAAQEGAAMGATFAVLSDGNPYGTLRGVLEGWGYFKNQVYF